MEPAIFAIFVPIFEGRARPELAIFAMFVQPSTLETARLLQPSRRLGSGNDVRTPQRPGIPSNPHERLFHDNANRPRFRYEAGGRAPFSANRQTGLDYRRPDGPALQRVCASP